MRKITFERTFAGLRFCVLQLATMLLTTEVSSSSARRRWAWEEWEWVLINFTIRPVTGLQKNKKAWIIYIYFLKKTIISILTHSEHQQDTSAASAQSTRNTWSRLQYFEYYNTHKKPLRLSLWFNFLYLKIKLLLHWNNQRIIKPF